jgi:hypothetical protein
VEVEPVISGYYWLDGGVPVEFWEYNNTKVNMRIDDFLSPEALLDCQVCGSSVKAKYAFKHESWHEDVDDRIYEARGD